MTIDFTRRVAVPDSVLVRRLDDESVILDLETESYYGLDDVAAAMWSHLVAAESIEAACEALLAEYDVEPERLRADLAALLEQLVEKGLVELRDGQAA